MCLPLKKLLGLSNDEKVYLEANQFDHKGPLKIEIDNEVKIAKDTCLESAETDSASNGEKHFTFAEQHEVFDIGPEVEIAPQA